MKSSKPFKELGLVFLAALVLYLAAYAFIEHRRERSGPWLITFQRQTNGTPELIINQSKLQIAHISIEFTGIELTNDFTPQTIRFAKPRPVPFSTPFGECIFMDTTFQPGTVVIKAFNHEIQLLPRILTIDGQEHIWHSGECISLTPTNVPIGTNSIR